MKWLARFLADYLGRVTAFALVLIVAGVLYGVTKNATAAAVITVILWSVLAAVLKSKKEQG